MSVTPREGVKWGGIVAGGRCAPGASRRGASRSSPLCEARERARNRAFGVEADAPVPSPVPSLITANSFPDNRQLFPSYFPCSARANSRLSIGITPLFQLKRADVAHFFPASRQFSLFLGKLPAANRRVGPAGGLRLWPQCENSTGAVMWARM